MVRQRRCWCLLAAVCLLIPNLGAARPFDEMIRRMPSTTNAIVLIDVTGMLESPLGVKEEWAKKHSAEFAEGSIHIPPGATHMFLAAQLNERLKPVWEMAMVHMPKSIDMAKLAKREQSTLSTMAGHKTVLSARNVFFVELADGIGGAMAPANRQELGRWLRFADSNKDPALSTYLRAAAGKLDVRTQIVMAVDMMDMVDPLAAKTIVVNSKVLAGKKIDIDLLSNALTRLQGITLTVRIGDALVGSDRFKGILRVDFSDSIASFKDDLKPLFEEILDQAGASIADFKGWEVRIEDRAMLLQGPLTGPGIRKLLTVIQPPAPTVDAEEIVSDTPKKDPKLTASLRYYKAVSTLINDLRKELLNTTAYEAIAHWHETYSRKIDGLPTLNVDDELLQWGSGTAMAMRTLAASLHGAAIDNTHLEAQKQYNTIKIGASYGYGGSGGPWGGSYGGGYNAPSTWHFDNYNEIKAKQAKNVKGGETERSEIWQQIDTETAAIRRKMTSKFQVEF